MRDQYAGDITDAIKFALLRRLAGDDRDLGVLWYYNPGDDSSTDGGHVNWKEDASWALVDSTVHEALASLPERSVEALEAAPIWLPSVKFFRTPVPKSRESRYEWAHLARAAVRESTLVFLDPDNGPSFAPSVKHATFSEIRRLRLVGRTLVVIRFPNRSASHDSQVAQGQEHLLEECDAESVRTLRVTVSTPGKSRTVWFDVIDADAPIVSRLEQFAQVVGHLPGGKAYVV